MYGHDGEDAEPLQSLKARFTEFIPTPKPRRRRKPVPLKTPVDLEDAESTELEYHQDPHVSFVVKAVSALTAAFRLVQIEQCTGDLKG